MNTGNILPKRPVVLTIAGFDPSAGAGLLADIKTFERLKTYGIAVQTALTVQTDIAFEACHWTPKEQIISQLETLLARFPVKAVKIGIVESQEVLLCILESIRKYSETIPIVWDTVVQASTGFYFHQREERLLEECLSKITIITPNRNEMNRLFGDEFDKCIPKLANQCAIYLKGGHWQERKGEDIFYVNETTSFVFKPKIKDCSEKHGSGCVLSSALAAYLALGFPLHKAGLRAKHYTERFLQSNPSLLGYHKI